MFALFRLIGLSLRLRLFSLSFLINRVVESQSVSGDLIRGQGSLLFTSLAIGPGHR